MAAPPSYDASINDKQYSVEPSPAYMPPQPGVGYPPSQSGMPYPPPQAGMAYPPPQAGMAYPPPQAGMAYPPPKAGYQDNPNFVPYPPETYAAPESEVGYSDDKGLYDTDIILSFDDKTVRLGFIRKVFAILSLQMVVTIAMTAWFLFHEPTKDYVQHSLGMYIASYVLFLVLYFVLACCTSVARKHPINLILMGLFTLSLSYLVAAISTFHDTKIVIAAFGITLFVTVAIIIFASQTKYDFTTCGGVLFVCSLSLFFFGLFAGVFVPLGYMSILNVVYSSLGALLFMAFLAFDTQLIMGGKKYEISPEDYIFAALMLYVDVIYIFLYILALLGGSSK